MYRISKLLQQLLGKKFGDRCDIRSSAFVALEGRFVGSVEYEDGMNGECDQTKEAVVEGAQSRIGAA